MKGFAEVAEAIAVSRTNSNNEGESQVNEQSKGNAYLTVDLNARTEETISANETCLEMKERTYRCVHGNVRVLCVTCAGLSESDLKRWDRLRTRERHITPLGTRLASYSETKISGSDCVLASSTGLFYCRDCDTTFEPDELTSRKSCPMCGEFLNCSGEFFQPIQFSLLVKTGTTSSGDMSALASYTDTSSGIRDAVTGRIRIPLDAPRETRAYPPEWLYDRRSFLETLKKSRALRGEQILST